ncbi:MAG: hypothetical protein ABSB10_02940 [Candidatus Bathyarchaeia archaeon]
MDTTIIITLLFSLIALILSLFSLVYTRQQAKSSNEQTRLSKENSENKKMLANASKAIIEAIDKIKQTTRVGVLTNLDLLRADILKEMRDNPKGLGLFLTIIPESFQVMDAEQKIVTIKKTKDLIHILNSVKTVAIFGNFHFKIEPNIVENKFIELGNLLEEFRGNYIAFNLLEEHEDVIRSRDNAIIDEFKNIVDQMVEVLVNGTFKEHLLNFDSQDKSDEILKKLNEGIIDMRTIRMLEKTLSKLCDDRLVPVQQKLFEMALQ